MQSARIRIGKIRYKHLRVVEGERSDRFRSYVRDVVEAMEALSSEPVGMAFTVWSADHASVTTFINSEASPIPRAMVPSWVAELIRLKVIESWIAS